MKKTDFIMSVMVLCVSFLSCTDDNPRITGSGTIIAQDRDVADFNRVYSPASIEVIVLEGENQGVEVKADDNVINRVRTTVASNTLEVALEKGSYNNVTITVTVVVPNITGLENSGSGNMTVSGFSDLNTLEIDNTGSGNIGISGSGNILTLRNEGSGSFKGFNFTVKDCTVNNLGSGNCEITCTDNLNGSNSGSGSIFYKGSPTLDVTNTGSGSVVDSN